MNKILFSYFYENFCRIKLPNGEIVKPKLSETEKKILDKSEELSVPPYVRVWRRILGWQYIVHPAIEDALLKEKNKL